jgi:uncharacterized UPF0146 family protein
VSRRSTDALADRLARYEHVVEVGIGRRTDIARALAERGVAVTATDVYERSVPDGVTFVVDDVTDPDPAVYADADAVYALNLPPELHRPLRDVASAADADLLFTTLGGDQPSIPVERETVPGDTLYRARRRPP